MTTNRQLAFLNRQDLFLMAGQLNMSVHLCVHKVFGTDYLRHNRKQRSEPSK